MEWLVLILWLSIINGALGGQYILNWMGNQPKYTGGQPVDVSPGVMTFWREVSKFVWAAIAVTVEVIKGKPVKYLWPGALSMITIVIAAFTGVIENIGFFYLPRYYSPHIYAPYVNIYLAFLPFLGKFLFDAKVRKEHWIGITLVIIGLATPHLPVMLGREYDPKAVLDFTGIIWIIIINLCLCSQQILNNKTVQTVLPNVGPNALVVWREIWKMLFISIALFSIPIIGKIVGAEEGNRFFSLFSGSIFPNNWMPILFVVLAGLTGYIYSFGFFKLSKFAAHFWVPYTNIYLALLPFIMFLFGKNVTGYQIAGAVIVTAGLMVGVSDYSKNKVEEIEKKYKDLA
ncbi:hypothetical protein APF79_06215 [bacterium BRH_c32]|nr:MAG: hypothetical protein APF79_06215 [bacterium BRH_c32]